MLFSSRSLNICQITLFNQSTRLWQLLLNIFFLPNCYIVGLKFFCILLFKRINFFLLSQHDPVSKKTIIIYTEILTFLDLNKFIKNLHVKLQLGAKYFLIPISFTLCAFKLINLISFIA